MKISSLLIAVSSRASTIRRTHSSRSWVRHCRRCATISRRSTALELRADGAASGSMERRLVLAGASRGRAGGAGVGERYALMTTPSRWYPLPAAMASWVACVNNQNRPGFLPACSHFTLLRQTFSAQHLCQPGRRYFSRVLGERTPRCVSRGGPGGSAAVSIGCWHPRVGDSEAEVATR